MGEGQNPGRYNVIYGQEYVFQKFRKNLQKLEKNEGKFKIFF